jgi:hypothetical protein
LKQKGWVIGAIQIIKFNVIIYVHFNFYFLGSGSAAADDSGYRSEPEGRYKDLFRKHRSISEREPTKEPRRKSVFMINISYVYVCLKKTTNKQTKTTNQQQT